MVATTTQLNAVGAELGVADGVHALTDVTGFGLFGHLLEMCRGAGLDAVLDIARVPLLPRARELAAGGFVTGASHRNLASYGDDVAIAASRDPVDALLLSDPQTSGGLLVAVDPSRADALVTTLHDAGFVDATCVGRFTKQAGPRVRIRAV